MTEMLWIINDLCTRRKETIKFHKFLKLYGIEEKSNSVAHGETLKMPSVVRRFKVHSARRKHSASAEKD